MEEVRALDDAEVETEFPDTPDNGAEITREPWPDTTEPRDRGPGEAPSSPSTGLPDCYARFTQLGMELRDAHAKPTDLLLMAACALKLWDAGVEVVKDGIETHGQLDGATALIDMGREFMLRISGDVDFLCWRLSDQNAALRELIGPESSARLDAATEWAVEQCRETLREFGIPTEYLNPPAPAETEAKDATT